MASKDLPEQHMLEAELGGPMQFHGLIAPPLPAAPVRPRLAYRRHWKGGEQEVHIHNPSEGVPHGSDALVLQALLMAPPALTHPYWVVLVRVEELDELIWKTERTNTLTLDDIVQAVTRLQTTRFTLDAPGGSPGRQTFHLIDRLQIHSQSQKPGGEKFVRLFQVEFSPTTLTLEGLDASGIRA
ncbi:hypothetical protein [Deinococcus sp. QL22]|uniref:hypothetical protein n=1 Tax=Deinococcus sp. QL22 TaxID=2939437 RepID=UPI0020175FD6|nr:hypothetical protein [Deinococcus sp. QL22]UQN10647.1 hypothetical protein M1R55_30190 [Deinococcus sp. QL22]